MKFFYMVFWACGAVGASYRREFRPVGVGRAVKFFYMVFWACGAVGASYRRGFRPVGGV